MGFADYNTLLTELESPLSCVPVTYSEALYRIMNAKSNIWIKSRKRRSFLILRTQQDRNWGAGNAPKHRWLSLKIISLPITHEAYTLDTNTWINQVRVALLQDQPKKPAHVIPATFVVQGGTGMWKNVKKAVKSIIFWHFEALYWASGKSQASDALSGLLLTRMDKFRSEDDLLGVMITEVQPQWKRLKQTQIFGIASLVLTYGKSKTLPAEGGTRAKRHLQRKIIYNSKFVTEQANESIEGKLPIL